MRAIVVATGPSLTPQALELVNASKLPKFGCNLTFRDVLLDVFYANNKEFWDYYGEEIAPYTFDKWTYEKDVAEKHGVNYIEGVWRSGFSGNLELLHWGHSSGYELMGIAYGYGVREMVLIGYDCKMPPGYNGFTKTIGDGKRNYFGEYPDPLKHWPRFNIDEDGTMNGLLNVYRGIDCEALGLRIINCSPGSALDFFEIGNLEDWL